MLVNIFDTHAHYDDERFLPLLDELMECQRAAGVTGIITCGCDEASSSKALELAEKYDIIYAAVGVHPSEAGKLETGWLERIRRLAAHPKCVAIGEIGLDFYWPEPDRDTQREVFRAQLELARELELPVEIHDRDAHGEVFAFVKEYRPRGVLHRYSGSPEMAREYVKLGMHLGFGGALTYRNSKKETATVAECPLEHILLETDCPYLSPAQRRGTTCTSDMIALVAERVAEIKGGSLTAQEVLDKTAQNARELFGIA
ncbi:MAG: TatD family hydrolase [Oscillospiraceae bacterium]|nr:TatD family hydrolase [Oscillospiraceae bacterium]